MAARTKKTAARKAPARKAAPKAAPEVPGRRSISEGVAASWKDPAIAAKRAERSAVEVDGVNYRSVRAAYRSLGLDERAHIPFRIALKKAGTLTAGGRKWKIVPLNYDVPG